MGKLTHGEAWYKRVMSNHKDIERGRTDFHLSDYTLPDRMGWKQAAKYYNEKLYNYWLTQLEDSLSEEKKIIYLDILTGRTR